MDIGFSLDLWSDECGFAPGGHNVYGLQSLTLDLYACGRENWVLWI